MSLYENEGVVSAERYRAVLQENARLVNALYRIRNLTPEWGESPVKKVSPTVEMARTIARQALAREREAGS